MKVVPERAATHSSASRAFGGVIGAYAVYAPRLLLASTAASKVSRWAS